MAGPTQPTAAQLTAQIAALQAQLAALSQPSSSASSSITTPVASTSALSSGASTPAGEGAGVLLDADGKPLSRSLAKKLLRRNGPRQVGVPLPPALAKAPKRHIALLFSYEGWAHSGLAYQPPQCPTPLTTVEGCLLDALELGKLIEPIAQGEGFGCGFERCGRTDAGVSSSAQVVNLWVRSDLEDPMGTAAALDDPSMDVEPAEAASQGDPDGAPAPGGETVALNKEGKRAGKKASTIELPYVNLLNKLLPPTIRILAWSPVTADFSSRFSCIWRHYKYFFSASPTSPFVGANFDFGSAYPVEVQEAGKRWQDRLAALDFGGLELDVDRMRDAVRRLVGGHDFRNFCKVDPPKQLPNHIRRVMSASIDRVEGEDELFVLNLRGGAFLYNQVRHIVALLFMVGARVEEPDIIDKLLWTSDRTPTTIAMQPELAGSSAEVQLQAVMDRKPGFEMADDLPLILWQCGFNSSQLSWRVDNTPRSGDVPLPRGQQFGGPGYQTGKLLSPEETFRRQFLDMHESWTRQRLKATVLEHHLASFARFAPAEADNELARGFDKDTGRVFITPTGAGRATQTRHYNPLLTRPRGLTPDEINKRWAEGRGKDKMRVRAENQEESDRARELNLKKKAEAFRLKEIEDREKAERLEALARAAAAAREMEE